MDKEAYPNRRKGCETIENAKDILIDSPATKNYRKKIRQFLANRNVNIDVDTQIWIVVPALLHGRATGTTGSG